MNESFSPGYILNGFGTQAIPDQECKKITFYEFQDTTALQYCLTYEACLIWIQSKSLPILCFEEVLNLEKKKKVDKQVTIRVLNKDKQLILKHST